MVSATPHLSPMKAGAAAAVGTSAVIAGALTALGGAGGGGVGGLGGGGVTWMVADWMAAAVVAYAAGSSWARGLPQSTRNRIAATQV